MESSFAPRSPNVTCFNRAAPSRGCFAGTRVYVYDPSFLKKGQKLWRPRINLRTFILGRHMHHRARAWAAAVAPCP